MNKNCICKMAGYCNRHKMRKTQRQYELCSGTAGTKDCGLKYWNAWEQGKLGATIPHEPLINPPDFCDKMVKESKRRASNQHIKPPIKCRYLGKVVSNEPCTCGSHVLIQVNNCNNSNVKKKRCVVSTYDHSRIKDQHLKQTLAICDSCVYANIDTPKNEPFPFPAKPKLTLICHCWPNGDGWKKHIEYLAKTDGLFDRRIMAVATGPGTASFEEVKNAFGDGWEYLEIENDPNLHEVHTARIMMDMVQSTDPNDVTFYMHMKGVKDHTANSEQVRWWIEAMYETVIYNTAEVIRELENGASIVGSFRRFSGHFRTRYSWHYSGTFYAFRNSRAFENGIPAYDEKWWGTESWVGQHFSKEESACIFGDNAGHLYNKNNALEQALIEWKKQNGILYTEA